MKTLVLNAGYEPIQMVSWQRALCLVLSSKADVVAEYGNVVRSVRAHFQMPSVVRLKSYVRVMRGLGIVRCTRKNVFLRDKYECQYCGVKCNSKTITIDHVLPKSKGGKTSWTNVVAACTSCNRTKGSQSPEEKGMKLRTRPKRPTWYELSKASKLNGAVDDWLPFIEAS